MLPRGKNKLAHERKWNMKRLIMASLLLSAIVLESAPVFAENTCICAGIGSSGLCGGIGGSFPTKRTSSDAMVLMCLKSDKARSDWASYNKAYDGTTGWFCWKGTL